MNLLSTLLSSATLIASLSQVSANGAINLQPSKTEILKADYDFFVQEALY